MWAFSFCIHLAWERGACEETLGVSMLSFLLHHTKSPCMAILILCGHSHLTSTLCAPLHRKLISLVWHGKFPQKSHEAALIPSIRDLLRATNKTMLCILVLSLVGLELSILKLLTILSPLQLQLQQETQKGVLDSFVFTCCMRITVLTKKAPEINLSSQC